CDLCRGGASPGGCVGCARGRGGHPDGELRVTCTDSSRSEWPARATIARTTYLARIARAAPLLVAARRVFGRWTSTVQAPQRRTIIRVSAPPCDTPPELSPSNATRTAKWCCIVGAQPRILGALPRNLPSQSPD